MLRKGDRVAVDYGDYDIRYGTLEDHLHSMPAWWVRFKEGGMEVGGIDIVNEKFITKVEREDWIEEWEKVTGNG